MTTTRPDPTPLAIQLDDRYADSDGVRIHYVTGGDGPLIVLVHGFPDYWYSWHHQLDALATTHRIAAMDTRGFNLSDRPDGEQHYDLDLLANDIAAVIWNEGHDSAVIIGHDWGGATAWRFAATYPAMTDRLIVINTPHPNALARELAQPDSAQRENSRYVDDFRRAGAEADFDPAELAEFMSRGDDAARRRYRTAFDATDFTAAMNYYRRNYPSPDATSEHGPSTIEAPVLQIHGLADPAFHPDTLNGTIDFLDAAWTLVTIPDAGHWPHHDHPYLVTSTITNWLALQPTGDVRTSSSPPAIDQTQTQSLCCAPRPAPPT